MGMFEYIFLLERCHFQMCIFNIVKWEASICWTLLYSLKSCWTWFKKCNVFKWRTWHCVTYCCKLTFNNTWPWESTCLLLLWLMLRFVYFLSWFYCFLWDQTLKLHLSSVMSMASSDTCLSFSRSIPSLLPNPTMLSVLPPQSQPPHIPQPLTAALWSQTLTPNTLPWRSEDFTSLLPRPGQGATRSRLSLQENQLPKWLNGASRNPKVKMALRNRILALWIWMMQAFQLVMCSDGSVWRMIHLFGPLNFLARTLNQRKL